MTRSARPGRVRVDANGGWNVEHAARMLRALGRFGLEYAEQPCATLAELAELRRLVDVPLAADESIRRAEDPMAVRAAGAADIVVLKAQPLGGVRAALRIAAACGLPVVVSSAVESSVGLAAGVALAAALPELPYDCGLATMSLLTGDVTAAPLAAEDGTLPVRRAASIPARLSAYETDPAPWVGRMRAAAEFLAPFCPGRGTGAGGPGHEPVHRVRHRVRRRADPLWSARGGPGAGLAQRPAGNGTFHRAGRGTGGLRLHVRIDERSAAFLGLGLAKAGRRPVVLVCTSGTAAAHFHAAVIEADEAGVPLIVLTADRPPELRGTGTSQTIDQLKLYGGAVRWFSEAGVPEERPGMVRYWRSLACRAWAMASGGAGGLPGPVHVNLPFRDPLVPDADRASAAGRSRSTAAGRGAVDQPWAPGRGRTPAGRDGGGRSSWTGPNAGWWCAGTGLRPGPLLDAGRAAGWPVLAEPSSGARRGPDALSAYGYLLGRRGSWLRTGPRSSSRPGGRACPAASWRSCAEPGARRPGTWCRAGAGPLGRPGPDRHRRRRGVRLARAAAGPGRLRRGCGSWQRADAAARRRGRRDTGRRAGASRAAAGPRPGRGAAGRRAAVGRVQPAVRDLDQHMAPRTGLRVLASRGASGIDGLVSSAIGAALAHQAAGGGPAVALLGDLAFLHDAPGLMLGPAEPRPDLCLVVVNNDGGGIFSDAGAGGVPGPFERLSAPRTAADVGRPGPGRPAAVQRLDRPGELAGALAGSRAARGRSCRPARGARRCGRAADACAPGRGGLSAAARGGLALQRVLHRAELDLGLGQLGHRVRVGHDAAARRTAAPASRSSSAHRSAMPHSPLP